MSLVVALPLAVAAWGSAWATLSATVEANVQDSATSYVRSEDGRREIAGAVLEGDFDLSILEKALPIGVVVEIPEDIQELDDIQAEKPSSPYENNRIVPIPPGALRRGAEE